MDYKVLSENIEHPLLKPVLEELIPVFEKEELSFTLLVRSQEILSWI